MLKDVSKFAGRIFHGYDLNFIIFLRITVTLLWNNVEIMIKQVRFSILLLFQVDLIVSIEVFIGRKSFSSFKEMVKQMLSTGKSCCAMTSIPNIETKVGEEHFNVSVPYWVKISSELLVKIF